MHEPSLETRLEVMLGQMAVLQAQIDRQQAELNELKGRPVTTGPSDPALSSRRKMLRQLAGGMMAGMALAGAALANPTGAEARLISNPSGSGLDGRVGSLIMPPGSGALTGTLDGSYKVGVLASANTTLNLTNVTPSSGSSLAIYADGSNGGDGIYATTDSGGNGILAKTSGTSNASYAIWGISSTNAGYAGVFSGNVSVVGNMSKTSGSFKIDHPLDPANQYLYHSFVESPDMLNIYNGLVTLDGQGTATVALPAWFETLNTDFRYGLTPIGGYAPLYIAEEVKGGQFKLAGGQAGQRVSWQVTGIRQDEWAKAHRIPVEETKPAHERGLYLHPELFGQPPEKSLDYPRLNGIKRG